MQNIAFASDQANTAVARSRCRLRVECGKPSSCAAAHAKDPDCSETYVMGYESYLDCPGEVGSVCEVQKNGKCDWTPTKKLIACFRARRAPKAAIERLEK